MRRKPFQRREIKRPFRINQEINVSKVRLIAEDGEMQGVVATQQAIGMAEEAGLDLVEISPQSDPPVCKIINYGRFIYEREKKKKEGKKHQKLSQLKEIKIRPKTDVHDYNFKVRRVRLFLENGDKVKITVRFKGREMAFTYLGQQQIDRVIKDTEDLARVESQPKLEGRTLFMILTPLKVGGIKKSSDKEETEEEEKEEVNNEDVSPPKVHVAKVENDSKEVADDDGDDA